jgi:hypothetical protein
VPPFADVMAVDARSSLSAGPLALRGKTAMPVPQFSSDDLSEGKHQMAKGTVKRNERIRFHPASGRWQGRVRAHFGS